MRKIMLLATVTGCLAGCAQVATAPANPTAEKTVGSICATLGAAAKAVTVAAPLNVQKQFEALDVQAQPECKTISPSAAVSASLSNIYTQAIAIAAPYLGDAATTTSGGAA